MNINKIKSILFICFVLSSCTSHSTVNLKQLDKLTLIQYHENKLSFYLKPFVDKKDLIKNFDCDLIKKEIIPVQVRIVNKTDSDIGVNKENFSLIDPEGKNYFSISSEESFNKAKPTYWSTPVWLAAFGVWGFFGSAGNIADTRIKLDSDLQSKLFKSGIIAKNAFFDGIIFFEFNNKTRNLKNWVISIPIFHRSTGEKNIIEINL